MSRSFYSHKIIHIKYMLIILILILMNTVLFAGQENNAQASSNHQTNAITSSATEHSTTPIDFDYFMVGMRFYGAYQNAFTDPPLFDNDVSHFAYDLCFEFSYLFKHVLLNINFEYSNFKTKMNFKNTSSGDYSLTVKQKTKVINFTFGYTKRLSKKLVLVLPAIGFGYQDFDNPGTSTKHRSELYYLILSSSLYVGISKIFHIGFILNFKLLLSHNAEYDHPTNGEGKAILNKGLFFDFNVPLTFNISKRFFIKLVPWFEIFHSPAVNATHINIDTGSKVKLAFHKMFLYSGGVNISFGVYF